MDEVLNFTDKFMFDDFVALHPDESRKNGYQVSRSILYAASSWFKRTLSQDATESASSYSPTTPKPFSERFNPQTPDPLSFTTPLSSYYSKRGTAARDFFSSFFGGAKSLVLPGDDDTLRTFIFYLLNGHKLPRFGREFQTLAAQCDSENIETELRIGSAKYQSILVKLWYLAEWVGMPQLQDIAMLDLYDFLHVSYVQVEIIELVSRLTRDGLQLRDMILQELAWNGKSGCYGPMEEQRLGKIPGLAEVLARKLTECPGQDCGHQPHCAPSVAGVAAYLVLPGDEEQRRRLAALNGV